MEERKEHEGYVIQKNHPQEQRRDFLFGRGVLPGDKIFDARELTHSEQPDQQTPHNPPES